MLLIFYHYIIIVDSAEWEWGLKWHFYKVWKVQAKQLDSELACSLHSHLVNTIKKTHWCSLMSCSSAVHRFDSLLVLELVGQPVEALIQAVAAGGASGLDVPVTVAEWVKAQFVSDLCCVHGVWQILHIRVKRKVAQTGVNGSNVKFKTKKILEIFLTKVDGHHWHGWIW